MKKKLIQKIIELVCALHDYNDMHKKIGAAFQLDFWGSCCCSTSSIDSKPSNVFPIDSLTLLSARVQANAMEKYNDVFESHIF